MASDKRRKDVEAKVPPSEFHAFHAPQQMYGPEAWRPEACDQISACERSHRVDECRRQVYPACTYKVVHAKMHEPETTTKD